MTLLLLGVGASPAGAASSVTVDVPVDHPTGDVLVASWHDLTAPASAPGVHIALPEGSEAYDPEGGLAWLEAFVDAGDQTTTTSEGLSVVGTTIDVDLPTVRAALGGSPTTIGLTFRSSSGEGPTVRALELDLTLNLTDAAPAETTIALSLEDAFFTQRGASYAVEPVLVSGGQQLILRAPAGFWNDPESSHVDALEVWTAPDGQDEGRNASVRVSTDGALALVDIPENPRAGHHLIVDRYSHGMVDQRVVVPLESFVSQYVTSVYQDLFGRAPDPTGLAGWTHALENGTPYGAVADGITYSDEFRLGLISDSYQQLLGRAPDTTGLYSWLRAMQGGMHIQQMETGFIASDEYYSRAGGSDADWLVAMYEDILGRTPSEAEVDGWVTVVRKNGRIDVARQFLYSTEYLTHVVDGYYQWLLGRSIDPTGARDWVRAIQQGVRSEAIIAGIIASQEYRNNVGR